MVIIVDMTFPGRNLALKCSKTAILVGLYTISVSVIGNYDQIIRPIDIIFMMYYNMIL